MPILEFMSEQEKRFLFNFPKKNNVHAVAYFVLIKICYDSFFLISTVIWGNRDNVAKLSRVKLESGVCGNLNYLFI